MKLLPPLVEQGKLIQDLRHLIGAGGFEPFVAAPLLEPRAAHFPDHWRADALGVERLARRLLEYAGLGKLDVAVTLQPDDRAMGWFSGIEDGRCHVGADPRMLATPDWLAGVMAHETAHAYRHAHGLAIADKAIEEPLTDLTTIYLGFGVLTANASYRYRAGGGLNWTRWSHQGGGYLSPEAMSFLLAVQVVVRGISSAERRRLAGHLEANQAGSFNAACAALDRDTLIDRLGLPPRERWPQVIAPSPQPFDTRNDPPLPDLGAQAAAARQVRLQDFPIFRVRHRATVRWAAFGMPIGIVAAIVVGRLTMDWSAVYLLLAAPLAGALLGRRRTHDRCSEPECTWVIPDDATTCPGCGGSVAGRIKHPNQRLAAREDLEGSDDDEMVAASET
jgi:hypothetical protein